MKILFCKCFGIGNAIMAIPAIKALSSLGHIIDVLVGDTPDDAGAYDVFKMAMVNTNIINHIWVGRVNSSDVYDLAILSIPFDGRWKNGIHFNANNVVDGRTRPDPTTTGLSSWKKHEVEYQIDNAINLGFSGEIPDCSFDVKKDVQTSDIVLYFGFGYKKDSSRFWEVKHWGNDNFIALLQRISLKYKNVKCICTGDMLDLSLSIKPIKSKFKDLQYYPANLIKSICDILPMAKMYIGNDTGMAHAAAAYGLKVITIHNLENSITKSHPWCEDALRRDLDGSRVPVSVDQCFSAFEELL